MKILIINAHLTYPGWSEGRLNLNTVHLESFSDQRGEELPLSGSGRAAQVIAGHFPFEPAGNVAASAAHTGFVEDFAQDIIQPALRQQRGERLAGRPACDAGPARCG